MTIINNGSELALLNIKTSLVPVGTKGRRAGIIRLQLFCRKRTGRTCAGTIKLRSTRKINPASKGPAKPKRRVTFATFEYQLAEGKRGYAIVRMTPEKLDLIKRLKSVAIQISVQVTDAGGNRQTIVADGRLRTTKNG